VESLAVCDLHTRKTLLAEKKNPVIVRQLSDEMDDELLGVLPLLDDNVETTRCGAFGV